MPELIAICVGIFEPSRSICVKVVAEIPMNWLAPAVRNVILDADGVIIDENPVTLEKVWKALKRNLEWQIKSTSLDT